MARADFEKLLEKIDKEMKESSAIYRTRVANKKTTTFSIQRSTILKTLSLLIERSVDNKKAMGSRQAAISTMLEPQGERAAAYKDSKVNQKFKQDLDSALQTLFAQVIRNVNTLVSTAPKDTVTVKEMNSNSIKVTLFEAESTTKRNTGRDNFLAAKNLYKKPLDNFFIKFLDILLGKNNKGFLSIEGAEGSVRTVSSSGDVFNLEHTNDSSNIKDYLISKTAKAINTHIENNSSYSLSALKAVRDAASIVLGIDKIEDKDTIEVFLGSQILNNIESGKEGQLRKEFRRVIEAHAMQLIFTPGSDDLITVKRKKIAKEIIDIISSSKAAKIKSLEDLTIKKSAGPVTKKNTAKNTHTKLKATYTPKSSRGKTNRAPKPSMLNLNYLIPLINKELAATVAANMGSPRLNYRTGRFAESVRVTDIQQTPKGFPSVGYTYMKYPYQTFEPGYKQGSPERDPRKLIDVSIREIAAKMAMGRFYTRRV